jgi:hypothetical protein
VLATGLGFIMALATINGGLRPPPLDVLARHQLSSFLTTYYCFTIAAFMTTPFTLVIRP